MDDHRAWPASVRARLIRWAPAVGWMTVIFVLSAQPGLRVAEDPMLDYVLRKVGHVAVFAVLAMLLTWPLAAGDRPHGIRAAVAGAVLYAVSDELHQGMVAGRTAALTDIGIDAVGAVLGGLTIRWLRARRATVSSR